MSLPSKNWYYAQGGQKNGPVTLAQIRNLLASGHIDRDADLIWSEGQDDWMPPSKVDGLEPPSGRLSVSGSTLQADEPHGPPVPRVQPVRFGLIAALAFGSLVLLVGGSVLLGYGFFSALGAPDPRSLRPLLLLALLAVAVGLGLLVAVVVRGCIALYRAWFVLQPFQVRLTPGLAVGLLFVPLFGLYWAFQALWGWARDYNRTIESDPSFADAPRATAGVFLAFCVLSVVRAALGVAGTLASSRTLEALAGLAALGNLVLALICAYQLCAAVNYFAGFHDGIRR